MGAGLGKTPALDPRQASSDVIAHLAALRARYGRSSTRATGRRWGRHESSSCRYGEVGGFSCPGGPPPPTPRVQEAYERCLEMTGSNTHGHRSSVAYGRGHNIAHGHAHGHAGHAHGHRGSAIAFGRTSLLLHQPGSPGAAQSPMAQPGRLTLRPPESPGMTAASGASPVGLGTAGSPSRSRPRTGSPSKQR